MNKDRESQEGLTEDEIQANTVQAYLNMYDLASPEEQGKMLDAISGRGPEYYPSAEDVAAGYAVSALEEFRGRDQAIKDVQTQKQAAKHPKGRGPRNGLRIWAHMGKFLRRER